MNSAIEQGADLVGLALYPAFLLAGLAGGLHCLGMCGPILLLLHPASGSGGEPVPIARRFLRQAGYHVGRIWTYSMLGLLAGLGGQLLRRSASPLGWQRPLGIVLGGAIVLAGITVLGVVPGLRLDRLTASCGIHRLASNPLVRGLLRHPSAIARLLVGVLLGLLPCGLVYALLISAATLPSPLHAAAAMAVFGLGTVPVLASVVLVADGLSPLLRRHGGRLVGTLLILAGLVAIVRATSSFHPMA